MSEAIANSKLAQVIETVKALTVMELSELVKALEKEFGVSAAAVAVAGPAAAAPAAVEAPTSFNVTLVDGSANKMGAIKAVREITGLGLGESKAMVEGAPKLIKEGVDKATADELVKKLEAAGAKVKVEGV